MSPASPAFPSPPLCPPHPTLNPPIVDPVWYSTWVGIVSCWVGGMVNCVGGGVGALLNDISAI